jgi:hypothetical protein
MRLSHLFETPKTAEDRDDSAPLLVTLTKQMLEKGKDMWLDITVPLAKNSMLTTTHRGRLVAIDFVPREEHWRDHVMHDNVVSIQFVKVPVQISKAWPSKSTVILDPSTFDELYTLKNESNGTVELCNAVD